MKFVLDASIILRQVADDPHRDMAARLLMRLGALGSQTAPALAFYEVGNGLRSLLESDAHPPTSLFELAQTLLYGVELAPPDPSRAGPIGNLCAKHRLTFYDAAYLDLAKRTDATLITNDGRLAEAGVAELGRDRCHRLEQAYGMYAQDRPG